MDTNNAREDEKTETRRFLFDVSFDVEEQHAAEEEEADDEPPEPVFTLEQLEEARQQGYREGREAGVATAANGIENEIMTLLRQIGEMLPGIAADQAASNDLLMHEGAEAAVTIVRKLMPTMIEPQSIVEIQALVSECLERLTHQPKISVRVAEQHVSAIETHLNELVAATGFDGRFLVEAEDNMAPTDCRVSWPSGGAERRVDAIWQEIDATLHRFVTADAEVTAPINEPPVADETVSDGADASGESNPEASSPDGSDADRNASTEPNDRRHAGDGGQDDGQDDGTDPSA
ncbi:MAG: hypothetical protein MJE12_00785 [Alphaproteobacteria bacterium]|nr:hypothetical protein [Alphaproteobacteria bacterium]